MHFFSLRPKSALYCDQPVHHSKTQNEGFKTNPKKGVSYAILWTTLPARFCVLLIEATLLFASLVGRNPKKCITLCFHIMDFPTSPKILNTKLIDLRISKKNLSWIYNKKKQYYLEQSLNSAINKPKKTGATIL